MSSSPAASGTIFGFDPTTVTLMAFNFVSAVGIVFANKYVFHVYNYNFACFVTSLHFVVTTLGGRICLAFDLYQVKKLNHMDVLPITASFCCFVVFNNLSLQHNSVGFYQLMKVLTTPVVVVLQRVFFDIHVETQLQVGPASRPGAPRALPALLPSPHSPQPPPRPLAQACLGVICMGVVLATVSDISVNFAGTFSGRGGVRKGQGQMAHPSM